MSLTNRQTVRSFALGFALGAIGIAVTVGHQQVPNLSDQVFPSAVAATVK